MEEQIILVDENDNEIGTGEKLKVHQEGKLHRAFSIFIFNSKGQLLLQKRAKTKYHSGGLWANTCCGHPRVGESTLQAAHRRLKEEMGFDCEIREIFTFIYNVALDHGLFENEYDHIFIGTFDKNPVPNPQEAEDYKWLGLKDLKKDVKENSNDYTYWFCLTIDKVASYIEDIQSQDLYCS